ncbi:class II aldolase/adducin family protein [Xanthobacter oligotrophicus]|uniref:class II aldolase/adducin family protein n=1 Tax=Xanthobacter oligotrophicus TaxID=2607286 RepID=UPI0011F2BBD2|nr:class II aldolase/adducin family protein [Xanthobacter oligotrophicus]MCG5237953.1 class II aldolase/adducin family protein [Xanthobacter oligotrophicus]
MNNDKMQQSLQRRATLRERVSDAEWASRVELAACYQLCAHYGMTDMIYNHISLRIPGEGEHFLINAFGLLYEEVNASNLVKVDIDGVQLDDDPLDVSPAGFVIHSAIHRARPDARCIFHTHTAAGVAVSAQEGGLLPISQHALRFFNRIGYHPFEGIALDLDEQERLVRDIGAHNALVLENHGLLTCGKSVRDAFELMYYLETACKIQVAAQSTGAGLIVPSEAVARRTAQQFEDIDPFIDERDWKALLRLLDRQRSTYAA